MEKVLLLSKSFSIFSALSIFTLTLNLILIWFSFDVVFQRPFFVLFCSFIFFYSHHKKSNFQFIIACQSGRWEGEACFSSIPTEYLRLVRQFGDVRNISAWWPNWGFVFCFISFSFTQLLPFSLILFFNWHNWCLEHRRMFQRKSSMGRAGLSTNHKQLR